MRIEKIAVAFIVLAGCALDADPVTRARVDELRGEGEARGQELADELVAPDQPKTQLFGVVTGVIAAITRAVNDGEIAHAEVALDRSEDPEVVAFAEDLLATHTAANQYQDLLLALLDVTPIDTPISVTLRTQNLITTVTLKAVPDWAFDAAYLDGEILVHAQTGVLLRVALPLEPTPAFRQYLVALLDATDAHLAEAIDLRLGLGD